MLCVEGEGYRNSFMAKDGCNSKDRAGWVPEAAQELEGEMVLRNWLPSRSIWDRISCQDFATVTARDPNHPCLYRSWKGGEKAGGSLSIAFIGKGNTWGV